MSVAPSAVEACCASLYGHPVVELIAGGSFHPGGLGSTRRLLDAAKLPVGTRILDGGCGLGASARLAALEFELAVDACDVSGAALRRARALADAAGAAVEFVEASILELPFEDARFGGVLAECVLSTTAKEAALAELQRVTAPGGALLVTDVTVSDAVIAPGLLAEVLCLSGAWRPGELEDVIAAAGFEIVRAWDESPGIAALLDRAEARIGLLAALSRDLPALGPAWGSTSGADAGSIAQAFGDARRLLAGSRIGYRAVVARAGPAN
ncbi:MAG: class I SAM-dependent methyltransferase [Chloroflexi bacterium]|nr:class I SAM-dependent methyltransferase [Chloroflexota bacterium]